MAIQSRAAETRQKILQAAVVLFADNGYLETTPRDIANKADLTTGAFYYHFDSKEDIASAIIDQGWPVVEASLAGPLNAPERNIETVIEAVFSVVDTVNRNTMMWLGFHLSMAIGHLSPPTRRAFRERVEAFCQTVGGAFPRAALRDGVSQKQAGELLWIALTGSQLLSDALRSPDAASFERLALVWKSALRSIVTDELLPALMALVESTAAHYEGDRSEEYSPAPGRVV